MLRCSSWGIGQTNFDRDHVLSFVLANLSNPPAATQERKPSRSGSMISDRCFTTQLAVRGEMAITGLPAWKACQISMAVPMLAWGT